MYSRPRSLPALGLLAGTKPSEVAARLSMAEWLLVVLLGTVTSVSSSTVAINRCHGGISKSVDHRRHGKTLNTLVR